MSDSKHFDPNSEGFDEYSGEEEFVSKTELKRQSEALQKLGETVVNLTPAHLQTIPLDDELADAVDIARRINRKKDGFRRQLQFIGKLMRARDTGPIEEAIAKLEHQHQAANAAFHRLEITRDEIIAQGDDAINRLLAENPQLERQKLRQLQRQVLRERKANKPPKAFRELFQYLKQTMDE